MSALTGLPRFEPAEAQLRTDLLAALNGVEVAGALLTAVLPPHPPRLSWFACAGGLAFALDRIGGETLHLKSADGVRAGEMLELAEPLLRAVEWALDLELEPESLEDDPHDGDLLWVRIEARPGDVLRDRVHLALPRTMPLIAAPASFAPGLLDRIPLPARLTLAGPRLLPLEAATLFEGDLVLLGEGRLRATLEFLERPPVAGLYDPATARFSPQE
jgi:hypothetical protein